MKKLKEILLVAMVTLLFGACNEQTNLTPDNLEFVAVAIPDSYKSNYPNGRTSSENPDIYEMKVKIIKEDGTEVIGEMRFTMPATGNETLEKFEMTNNLFNETGLEPDFWLNEFSKSQSNGRLEASCIASCQEAFTDDEGNKIKGRGACKAECWAQTALKAAAVVVAIIAL